MGLDLSELTDWSDEDLMESLNEIDDGLTDGQVTWVERFNDRMKKDGLLSDRQREVAEEILEEWNEKHG